MDVSIVILNYKSKGLIRQQLKYFFSQKISTRCETIVVDNASGDGIGSMIAAEFPQVRFIQQERNRGYAAGNNAGIAASMGRYVLISNPDIMLSGTLVEGLFAFMEKRPDVGIAGPKLMNPDGTLQYSCLRFPDFRLPFVRRTFLAESGWGKQWVDHYFMREWDHGSPRDVDWLFGACLMVRRQALEKTGMLDERFFLYLEDTDWCRRFWEQGYAVYYVPTVAAVHLLKRQSEGSLFTIFTNRSARAHVRSFFKYFLKYRGKKNPHSERPKG